MKKLIFILLFVFVFSFVSAEEWVPTINLTLDDFGDATINTSIWRITDPPVTETGGYMLVGGSGTNDELSKVIGGQNTLYDFKTYSSNTTLIIDLAKNVGAGTYTQTFYIHDNSSSEVLIYSYTGVDSSGLKNLDIIEIDYDNKKARGVVSGTPQSWKDISSLSKWFPKFYHLNGPSVSGALGLQVKDFDYSIHGTHNTSGFENTALKNKLLTLTINALAPNNLTLINSSFYINSNLISTKPLTGKVNTTDFNYNFSLTGNYNWSVVTCSIDNNCYNTGNTTIIIQNWTEEILYYPTTTTVGNSETFGVTLNLTQGNSVTAANLIYNNTVYSVSINSISNQVNITKDLTIPSAFGSIPFYFNFTLATGETVNSSSNNINVNAIGVDDCSIYSYVLYNFTMNDEQTLTKLNPSVDSTNSSLNLQIYNADGETLVSSYAKNYEEENSFSVCLQNPLTSTSDYKLDLQLQYTADSYVKEFYHIKDTSISSGDLNTNISLYLLDNESSQEFKILYKDASFLPLEGAVIQVIRNYIGEGIGRVVEQPITDSDGETLVHLELSDVVYTFIVLVGGEVKATFADKIPYCPNPTFTNCEIKLNELSSNIIETDFTTIGPLTLTFSSNLTTRIISSIFSVSGGVPALVSLNVTLFDAFGNTTVCSDSLTSSGGTLSCTVPQGFGNTTVVANLYYKGIWIGQKMISLAQDPTDIYGNNVMFLALIIFISLISISLTGNPITSVLFLMISLVALVGLNIFYSSGWVGAGATVLWFFIALILVIVKGGNR